MNWSTGCLMLACYKALVIRLCCPSPRTLNVDGVWLGTRFKPSSWLAYWGVYNLLEGCHDLWFENLCSKVPDAFQWFVWTFHISKQMQLTYFSEYFKINLFVIQIVPAALWHVTLTLLNLLRHWPFTYLSKLKQFVLFKKSLIIDDWICKMQCIWERRHIW
jgi:hypothetical protein